MAIKCKSFATGRRRKTLQACAGLCFLWLATFLTTAAEAKRLRIVTTILPVYCFAVNIAGGLADVENLLPGNAGPHEFQLTARDVRKIAQADLIVMNGLGLETWLEKAIRSAREKRPVLSVEASAGLDPSALIPGAPHVHDHDHKPGEEHIHHDHAAASFNVHTWLDPLLAMHSVSNILSALQKVDPPNSARYAENARLYVDRLKQLDSDLRAGLAAFQRVPFVTYHDAFPYFVRRYGLNHIGVVEEVPDVEPSPRFLGRLYQTIREQRARAVFTEPQFSSKLVRRMAKDLGLVVGELDPLETGVLRATAYEDGMRANLRSLQKCLK